MAGYGPLALVVEVAAILDALDIPYALGGSLASSLVGEPRATVDIDLAVRVDTTSGAELVDRLAAAFYVPVESARDAIERHASFNAIDERSSLKIDVFVAGDGILDRLQLDRRVRVHLPGFDTDVWVTSPEDLVLRKLDWFAQTGRTSERQWRDVIGILRVQGPSLDIDAIRTTASEVGLAEVLSDALAAAGFGGG